jgi:hypothetical protein
LVCSEEVSPRGLQNENALLNLMVAPIMASFPGEILLLERKHPGALGMQLLI